LLTGFDAPRNTVLYLARELNDHNLLQAIARVNRLFENLTLPKTAGFIIDYSENAQNIHAAMQLFGNYDEDDVKGALVDVGDKIKELESAYGALHDLFNGVAKDDEAYLQFLADEPTRKQFVFAFNEFVRLFGESMTLQDFAQKFPHLHMYREECKKFLELRKSANLRYADQTDLRPYKLALIKIMDDNIKAGEAELLTEQIDITDKELFEKALAELGSDKSKAEAIAAQTKKTITERQSSDPEFYARFSKKISEIIEAMRTRKLADIEALKQLRLISDTVLGKRDDTLPPKIVASPGADILYRNLHDSLGSWCGSEGVFEESILGANEVLRQATTVDWWRSHETKRQMRNQLDDYLYDEVKTRRGIELSYDQIETIISETMILAENNHDIFTKR
jgi:type I restriction enzyme R subunit